MRINLNMLLVVAMAIVLLGCGSSETTNSVVINEVMASNNEWIRAPQCMDSIAFC